MSLSDLDQLAAHVARHDPAMQGPAAAPRTDNKTVEALRAAAARYDARRDSFADGKGGICRDMAEKLARFGSFASERQASFARKLIEWSLPREQKGTVSTAETGFTPRPKTWKALQGFSRITIGEIKFSKKHEEQVWWISLGETLVGVIDARGAKGFRLRMRNANIDPAAIKAELDRIEADPVAAIAQHGLKTGTCACCSRELTDPESIARGIGPICAERLGAF